MDMDAKTERRPGLTRVIRVRVDEDTQRRARAQAIAEDRTESALIRIALKRYLDGLDAT